MGLTFSKEDVSHISEVLGAEAKEYENSWSWRLSNEKSIQTLVLSIHNNVKISNDKEGALISVQTQHGYFELHDCLSYMVFEPGEVIFVFYNDTQVSSLVVGRQSTCSMFTNISRDILNADFTTLNPAVLLAAMQLSLTETILE
jgi:hypothetical protein